jgi:hypothetical protein
VIAADVHTSPAVATPFPLSLLLWLHTPSPMTILFLPLAVCWLGICQCVTYGGSRGADQNQCLTRTLRLHDTSTPPDQGLFWAPWRGMSSASRPCQCLQVGLLWDGGNSRPTMMCFASCGFELCLNLDVTSSWEREARACSEPEYCNSSWQGLSTTSTSSTMTPSRKWKLMMPLALAVPVYFYHCSGIGTQASSMMLAQATSSSAGEPE